MEKRMVFFFVYLLQEKEKQKKKTLSVAHIFAVFVALAALHIGLLTYYAIYCTGFVTYMVQSDLEYKYPDFDAAAKIKIIKEIRTATFTATLRLFFGLYTAFLVEANDMNLVLFSIAVVPGYKF
ncbi:hypothetical protein ACJX0J_022654, partial [Zea mays]